MIWKRIATILLAASFSLSAVNSVLAADNSLPNERCPVEPDKQAREKFSVTYRGKKVYFCCSSCVTMFQQNPEEFLSGLPQFSAEEVAAALAEEKQSYAKAKEAAELPPVAEKPSLTGRELGTQALEQIQSHQPLLYYFGIVLILYVLVNRIGKGRDAGAEPATASRAWRIVRCFGSLAALIILVQLGLLVELARPMAASLWGTNTPPPSASNAKQANLDEADYVTAARFQQDMFQEALIEARANIPSRIKATYYRGNDERTPKLFNGGDYRTATFHLSLRTEDGHDINPGDLVAGHDIFLRVEIDRAPFTADGFFTPGAMAKVCLIGGKPAPFSTAGSVGGPVKLSIIKPNQRWEALYPIGSAEKGTVAQTLEGIVYLCRAGRADGRLISQSVHYGIQYRLVLHKGRVEPASHLYMAALFFTNRSLHNWFSHEPIPELPTKNTDDPILLGLDKYKAEQERAEKKR